jgi:outer membrane biosynthesis protein TonB
MLKRSFISSGALHVVVIAAASFAWPHAFELPDEPSDMIPVELMTVSEVTNVAPKIVEPPREPPTPQELAAAPPPPPIPPPPPLEEIEVAPEPEKPAPPPEPPKEVAAKPPPAPPVPKQRPRPEPPKPPPQPQFSVDSVLALLDSRAPKKTPTPEAPVADTATKGLGAQNASTLDLRDALLSQIRECWNVPVGAPTPEKLIVQVRVFLARDGSLAQPPSLEPQTRAAAASNPYMRTAAEAALRAVNVCEPYRLLPADRYETWREIVMTFDPSKMIGPQ